ncbi:hypothetical protein [Dyadobacter sp. CY323]|uniref:hypothetical protein n=1 Tax=Dyadobacter sp. CY323 TaxID=2907302 RepID=UPI001F4101CA|nr:hypothetical protein [Dyadobacter sp. CY323]MCE6990145.1 hypothetical protein [Dyadobacter sp. CY323]
MFSSIAKDEKGKTHADRKLVVTPMDENGLSFIDRKTIRMDETLKKFPRRAEK